MVKVKTKLVCKASPLMFFFYLQGGEGGRVSARNVWFYWGGGPLKIGKHNSLSPKKNYIGLADIVFQFLPPSSPPRVLVSPCYYRGGDDGSI